MSYLFTYCHDKELFKSKCFALIDAGKHKQYLSRNEDGSLNFRKFFVPVAYMGNKSIGYGSLPMNEIEGDAESGYAGLLADTGLIALAVGDNRSENSPHNQIRRGDDPQKTALYKSVVPDYIDQETGIRSMVMIPEVDG